MRTKAFVMSMFELEVIRLAQGMMAFNTPNACLSTARSWRSCDGMRPTVFSPWEPTPHFSSRPSTKMEATGKDWWKSRSALRWERRTVRRSVAEEASSTTVDASINQQQKSVDIPTKLPSECGIDYVPLATMLATGDLKGADQFTRDALIKAAGDGSQKRDFVYWTEVKNIPNTDMSTMENLWLKYSSGKFGYSVQRDLWRKTKGDFENFCRRIGWTTTDSEVERKLRWFGVNEFIYDVNKAPKGHLPLTSALRGTTLLKELMTHPVWDTEWQWK